jgi:integrase
MSYSIKAILLPYVGEHGRKLVIQVIYKRKRIMIGTPYRLRSEDWDGKQVVQGRQKVSKNNHITEIRNQVEEKLIQAIKTGKSFDLGEVVKGKKESPTFAGFIRSYAEDFRGKVDRTTYDMYKLLADELEAYSRIQLDHIDTIFLLNLERMVSRKVAHNTVHKKMKNYKKFLYEAQRRGLIRLDQFENYKSPEYQQKIPEYLGRDEIQAFKEVADGLSDRIRVAGYYFLLSCFAGYRISDCKRFNYSERVRGGKIILKAKKNGEIVSIPIFPELKVILEYLKDKPLDLSEPIIRDYCYGIAKAAGISRKITYHTSRHSFAMMLLDHDFSIEEVAE